MKILITGGSSGIGLHTALKLVKDNHEVTITYNSNSQKADELTKEFGVTCLQMDISNSESINNLCSNIENGDFEVLINNACPSYPLIPLRKVDALEFKNYLSEGVSVVHSITKAFVNSRKKKGGRVLNILSAYTLGPTQSQMAPYITLKYALLGLTKCMAKEYQSKGIIVNAVSPSMTDTKLLRETFPEKFIEMAKESNPNGEILEPMVVAESIVNFLKMDRSIVGVNLPITGSAE